MAREYYDMLKDAAYLQTVDMCNGVGGFNATHERVAEMLNSQRLAQRAQSQRTTERQYSPDNWRNWDKY